MDRFMLAPRAETYNFNDHSQRNWLPPYALTIQIVTTFLVWVRLLSRFSINGRPGFDDVLIFIAWILGTAVTAMCILSTYKFGFNKHIWDTPAEDYWKGALVAFVIELLFFWSTCFTKVSVLMFYRRLVAGTYSRKFKWAIWAAIGFVIAYTISFVVLLFTTCQPFEAVWMQYNSDWVTNHPNFFCASIGITTRTSYAAGALSVVTDFYSVMLPAVLILKIRVTKRQRYGLFFIFGMGYLVVIAGIVRTIYLGRTQAEVLDKSWVAFNVFIASIAECNVAIACACAPSLKSVFGRFFRDISSKYGSGGTSKSSSNSNSKLDSNVSSTTISRGDGPMEALKRTTSRLKAKMGSDKKEVAEMKDESSFKEAHEYGLDSLEPVASGLGDGLISPMEREFSRIMDHRDSQIIDDKEISIQRTQLTPHNIRYIPGPGSYIISPSPSVSSDDETSLVDKRSYSHDGGLPYGLPERDEQRQFSVWPRLPPTPPVPDVPPQFASHPSSSGVPRHIHQFVPRPSSSGVPRAVHQLAPRPSSSGVQHDIMSPLSTNFFYSEDLLDQEPRKKVRRKLSKEKWNQI